MDALEKLALWIGWAPIAIMEFLFMVAAKFFYDRELSNKDTTIQQLNFNIQSLHDELENSKQYQVDILVKSLSERVNIANQEIERLSIDHNASQEELAARKQELLVAQNETILLRAKLQKFEDELDDLLEPDYCETCDPDEDHMFANYIDWMAGEMYPLIGDAQLVERVGYCNYCTNPQVKCQVCGSITSLNLESDEEFECTGGCGNIYTIHSYIADKSMHYEIKVSRMEPDSDD